jgi:hypothetical protein
MSAKCQIGDIHFISRRIPKTAHNSARQGVNFDGFVRRGAYQPSQFSGENGFFELLLDRLAGMV